MSPIANYQILVQHKDYGSPENELTIIRNGFILRFDLLQAFDIFKIELNLSAENIGSDLQALT